MYQRNSKLGMLQKLLSILLMSGGCSRRIFTCLNAIGVTQSQKTWVRAMDQIGSGLVSKVQKLVQEGLEFYINFDNLDFKILANQVLTNHRNTDVHWINQYITFDQVPSTHLDDQKPLVDLKELPLTEYLLSQGEEKKFRSNITVLAARVLTKMVPSFQENLILDTVFSLLQLQLVRLQERFKILHLAYLVGNMQA
ncbi:uncharacterized protein LOC144654203 [Oculina patagonica]